MDWAVFAVSAALAVLVFLYSHFRFMAKLADQNYPAPPLRPWGMVVASLFVGVGCGVLAFAWQSQQCDHGKCQTDALVKSVGAVLGLGYFAYQIVGGSMFATMSVILTAERDPTAFHRVNCRARLVRGSQWLADIAQVAVAVHVDNDVWKQPGPHWHPVTLPVRHGEPLRMAPGEEMSLDFSESGVPSRRFYMTICVVSLPTYWPVPSQSFARVEVR